MIGAGSMDRQMPYRWKGPAHRYGKKEGGAVSGEAPQFWLAALSSLNSSVPPSTMARSGSHELS
jgi:hypothetical protein